MNKRIGNDEHYHMVAGVVNTSLAFENVVFRAKESDPLRLRRFHGECGMVVDIRGNWVEIVFSERVEHRRRVNIEQVHPVVCGINAEALRYAAEQNPAFSCAADKMAQLFQHRFEHLDQTVNLKTQEEGS